jgi:hypothetical protein
MNKVCTIILPGFDDQVNIEVAQLSAPCGKRGRVLSHVKFTRSLEYQPPAFTTRGMAMLHSLVGIRMGETLVA